MSDTATVVFVRRLNKAHELTYHRSDCRYVRDRDDVETVPFDEVQAAWDATADNGRYRVVWVTWRERNARINVCLTCLKIQMTKGVRPWPPSR